MLAYKHSSNLLNFKLIVDKLRLSAGQTVADFGCGRIGAFVFLLAPLLGDQGKIFAIDIIQDYLDLIKQEADEHNLTNIVPIWADLEIFNASRLPTASVDKVLIINTLHQVTDKAAVLKEAARVLKKNGELMIIDWQPTSTPFGPVDKVNKQEILNISQKLNLSTDFEFSPGQYHFCLILSK